MNTYRQDSDTKSFFTKVDTAGVATAMIRSAAIALLLIGALQLLMALYTWSAIRSPAIFFDCAINLACAFCLYRLRSRIAALVALTLAVAALAFTLILGSGSVGIILSLLAVWAGSRALEATVKLQGRLATPPQKVITTKSVSLAALTVLAVIIGIYTVVVFPPTRAEQKIMRSMNIDAFALLSRDRVKILKNVQVARYGFNSISVLVSQQGWGTVLKPGTEQLLSDRGWEKYQGRDDVYCKHGVQLSFTQTMYQTEGAVRIDMIYSHSSQKNCKEDGHR